MAARDELETFLLMLVVNTGSLKPTNTILQNMFTQQSFQNMTGLDRLWLLVDSIRSIGQLIQDWPRVVQVQGSIVDQWPQGGSTS